MHGLKVEPRDLAVVAIEDVEKIGEVGQDCQIRVLESCSSQVRSGQVRSGQVRSGWREEGGISPRLPPKWMISTSEVTSDTSYDIKAPVLCRVCEE